MSYDDHLAEDARLAILKELFAQTDHRLNESVLTSMLDAFGFRRSRDWVRTQMRKLAELGAVRVTSAGGVLIAELTRAGADHVEKRSAIEGVKRPSPEA